ncbi:hypothetical protein ABN584_24005 [Gloeocapsa sp. BRSZ]
MICSNANITLAAGSSYFLAPVNVGYNRAALTFIEAWEITSKNLDFKRWLVRSQFLLTTICCYFMRGDAPNSIRVQ